MRYLLYLFTSFLVLTGTSHASSYHNYRFQVSSLSNQQFSIAEKRMTEQERLAFHKAIRTIERQNHGSKEITIGIINGKTPHEIVTYANKPKNETQDHPVIAPEHYLISAIAIALSSLASALSLFITLKITAHHAAFPRLMLISIIAQLSLLIPILTARTLLSFVILWLLLHRISDASKGLCAILSAFACGAGYLSKFLLFIYLIKHFLLPH